jgi:membrane-bound ClpP family serine protease
MPTWNEILWELKAEGSTYDIVRRKYLKNLFKITDRNVIIYYSGWLNNPNSPYVQVNESDKNGFMAAIHHLDRTKGLDLILHTPGGDVAATESLVFYLRQMFGNNIRAIVPQIAMSAGTMIALACSEIVMGKHSSLGPIDPQFNGLSAHGIIEEIARASKEVKSDQSRAIIWQPILQKYPPTIIGECEKAIKWAEEMVKEWLSDCMFKGQPDADKKVTNVIKELGDHAITKSHARRISIIRAKELGLAICGLEDNHELQEAVMNIHHVSIITLDKTPAVKIIENHDGVAFIQTQGQVIQI